MTTVTIVFAVAACLLIFGVRHTLRRMDKRTNDLYHEVVLDDAEFAVTHEDRAALEAAAATQAETGWDMPDYADHHRAVKASVETYDLEQEMLTDLDEALTVVNSWDQP